MLSENILCELNKQVNVEFYSSYLYLSISSYLRETGLFGFSRWTHIQAKEELLHGTKLVDFIIDRKGAVKLSQIDKPSFDYTTPLKMFEHIYNHEKLVTKSVMEIAAAAENECDRTTLMFMDWYINEQVQEEYSVYKIISKLKTFGDIGSSLFLIDQECSQRKEE